MSRRVYIGSDGAGSAVIRAAKPGFDAWSAPLDQLLFDADAVPGRIINSGAQWCAWNQFQATQNNQPTTTTIAHGVPAGLSFIIIAVGQAQYSDGSVPDWRYWGHGTNGGTAGQTVTTPLGNPQMTGQYCTPFRFQGVQGTDSFGQQKDYWGGWWLSWDGSNIYVTNNCANGVYMRWQALEI